jgi:hypothetical protein
MEKAFFSFTFPRLAEPRLKEFFLSLVACPCTATAIASEINSAAGGCPNPLYRHARDLWRPEALLSFSAWLRICLRLVRSDPAFRNNHFRAQADYHVEGAKVLHFEDGLLPCLNEISAALDLPMFEELPHERRSSCHPAEPSPRDLELIQVAFAVDYEMFPRYRTGGTYSSPPAFQSALIPRSMPSFEPLPRLRSNISA